IDFFSWKLFFDRIPYCLDEVSFSKTARSIYKELIILLAWTRHSCLCGCICEFIERSDDECLECVSWIEIIFLVYVQIFERKLDIFCEVLLKKRSRSFFSGNFCIC